MSNLKHALIIAISLLGVAIAIVSYDFASKYAQNEPEQVKADTVYIDSFLIPFPVQVPIIEIPHPEHGRMIVNLNDSTIILTASGQVLVDFEDQDMINKYLYQQFNGQNINRKGE
jgi:hypothetical protein